MHKGVKIAAVIFGLAIGATAIVASMPEKPLMFRFVEEKMRSIITPQSTPGVLTPARDLQGTWISSLPGKGIQVYGKFVTGQATTTAYEHGDMELVIDSVTNNIASGKVRYTNLCVSGQTVAPKPVGTVSLPEQCIKDTGYNPITMRVSGSHLDFVPAAVSGATITMQGNFTTDIMSGTATVIMPAYGGGLKGEFHLNRRRE